MPRKPSLRRISSHRFRKRSASSRSGPCFSRPTAMTTRRISIFRAHPTSHARRTLTMRASRFEIRLLYSDRLRRRRTLRPQSLEILELTDLGSEHVNDHVAGIDHHPISVGQALDMDALDSGFLQGL